MIMQDEGEGESDMKKTLLIDANNLLYRAHHVSKLTNKKGERVSGAFNSMRMVSNLMKKFRPDRVVVAWDLGKSKSRLAIYPDYKQQRDKNRKEEDKIAIAKNKLILKKVFDHLPVEQIEVQDVEADDILWYLNEKIKGKKIIVSNDSDFLQLVDKKTSLFMPQAKPLWTKWDKKKKVVAKSMVITPINVDKFLGFPRKFYILWKSLVGDSSDNIHGIKGIGPVKAFKIINEGNTKKKKLPISADEMKILDRNKYLIAIGAVLQDDEIKAIRKAWKKSKAKAVDVRFSQVRKIFRANDFQTLINVIDEFEMRFNKLRKAYNGKEKSNKEKDIKKENNKKGKSGKAKKEKVKKDKSKKRKTTTK